MKVTTFLLAIVCATLAHARGVCDGAAFCGGIANAVCKRGYTCLDDPDDTCDPNNGGRDCSGCCVRLVIPEKSSSAAASVDTCRMCGGIANIQCDAGFTCMDDTRDNCDPNNGGRDCSGCCVRLVIPETRKPAPVVDTCTMCGGIANIQCDAGFTCMDDTRDNCDPNNGGRDCSGCCVRLVIPETKKPAPVVDTCTMCGGIANIQCSAGFTCMDDTRDNCDPNNGRRDCSGCCVRLVIPETKKPAPVVDTCTMCGGIANIQCDAGFTCMDDTRDNCDPNNGGRDCSGCCVRLVIPETKKPAPVVDTCTMCGGIANIQCSAGFTCMDDTRDNCDPNNGGRDCSGCCVRLVVPETKKPAPVVDTCTMCGGIANIQCDAGFTCMDDTRDNCDPNNGGRDCSGCCVRLLIPETRKPAPVVDTCTMCGGIANIQCDAGFTCMDDTRDNCDPNNGGRDCSGCCVRLVIPETKKPAPVVDTCTMCGGIANIQCDAGFTCMDDTRDNCDPNNGGRDCSGCCVRLVIPETKKLVPVVDTCTMCGGIANIQCSAGFTCMDDTRDNCDPNDGGRDCSGCCVRLVVREH